MDPFLPLASLPQAVPAALWRRSRRPARRGTIGACHAGVRALSRCCGAGREPRWLTDTLLRTLAELRADGCAHSIEAWRRDTLIGGAIRIGIGHVISGESLFGRHQDAARVAGPDTAARRLLGPG